MEDTQAHKPDPAPLLFAVRQLAGEQGPAVGAGVGAGQAAYVGDAHVDVLAAKAAGMTAIGVTWGAGTRTALQEAAASQLRGGGPVLVAAVDLTSDKVDLDADPHTSGQVRAGDIDLPRVAALHVGDDVVTGSRDALAGQDTHLELSWYDTTEIDHVVELVRTLTAST